MHLLEKEFTLQNDDPYFHNKHSLKVTLDFHKMEYSYLLNPKQEILICSGKTNLSSMFYKKPLTFLLKKF